MPLPAYLIIRAVLTLSVVWTVATTHERSEEGPGGASRRQAATLPATAHPPVPTEDADAWLVPDRAPDAEERALEAMAGAIRGGDHAKAAALAARVTGDATLGGYARLYQARARRAAGDHAGARRTAEGLITSAASSYLLEQARYLAADAAMEAEDPAGALAHLEALLATGPLAPERALLRLGRAHAAAGDTAAASIAFSRVYYDHALTPEAGEAASSLDALRGGARPEATSEIIALEIARAERLFDARRRDDARGAFAALLEHVDGDDRALVEVRLAQLEHYAGRYAAAREGLARHTRRGPRQAEARFFDLLALRGLGRGEAFVSGVREFIDDFEDSPWAADALDALGTYYILEDDDDAAARVFTELFDRYRSSERAERAAWKAGWHAYRADNYGEAIRIFEAAAAAFPRSTQRASWLYWAGRAHAEAGNRGAFQARHNLVLADYAHSYYGRQAARQLGVRNPAFAVSRAADRRSDRSTEQTAREAYPTGLLIHRLLRAGLYDDAMGEMRAAARAWGSTPALQATMAWTTRQQGDLLRASVLMKRAYPQYLSREGASLPEDVLRVTYPVAYWDLIRKYSAAHRLDPYMIAALIAQESGYDASARSAANAWGLMQIVPATGRAWARKLGIRPFTTASLTNPEINIRIGTAYFADQIRRLGSAHAALAAYNAGPTPARRWSAGKPGLDRDEWIDDIPYPETQFYVKRILGTAEDYRALYGGGFDPSLSRTAPRPRRGEGE